MGTQLKIYRIELDGEFREKFDELHRRTNVLISDCMSEEDMLLQILQIGMVNYERGLETNEKEEFYIC